MLVVLDAGVSVSAVITPGGVAGHIVTAGVVGRFEYLLCPRLVGELTNVMARPKPWRSCSARRPRRRRGSSRTRQWTATFWPSKASALRSTAWRPATTQNRRCSARRWVSWVPSTAPASSPGSGHGGVGGPPPRQDQPARPPSPLERPRQRSNSPHLTPVRTRRPSSPPAARAVPSSVGSTAFRTKWVQVQFATFAVEISNTTGAARVPEGEGADLQARGDGHRAAPATAAALCR